MTSVDKPATHLFDQKRATYYEDRVRQVVPGYDALHDLSLLMFNREIGNAGHFLIAGCGSGSELSSLSRQSPDRTFNAFDPSSDMIDMARARVETENISNSIDFSTGTIDNILSNQKFDAATLMLVLHFIVDDESTKGKSHLLRGISDRLKPGAPLIFAEALADRATPHFDSDMNLWRQHLLLKGMNPTDEAKGFKKIVSQMALINEDRLNELLKQSGFTPAQNFYRAHMIHGWITRKV